MEINSFVGNFPRKAKKSEMDSVFYFLFASSHNASRERTDTRKEKCVFFSLTGFCEGLDLVHINLYYSGGFFRLNALQV